MRTAMLVFAVGLLTGCPAGPGPTSLPSASGPADRPPRALVWQLVQGFPAPERASVKDVSAGGPGFVAVGQALEHANAEDFGPPGAIWTSRDGETWQRLPPQDIFRGADLRALTRFRGGFAVVGHVLTRELIGSAVWLSADAIAWRRALIGAPVSLADVVAGNAGLVAVGTKLLDEPNAGPSEAAVWTSADGKTWFETKDHPKASDLDRVVALPGLFLAFGRLFDPGGRGDVNVIWRSKDGKRWEEVAQLDGWPRAAVAKDGRLLVLGVGDAPMNAGVVGALWTSADGQHWSPRFSDASMMRAAIYEVVERAGGLVAIGTVDLGKDRRVPSSWVSRDGIAWIKGPDLGVPGGFSIDAAAAGEDRIVVVGSESGDPLTNVPPGGVRIWVTPAA